VIVDDALIGDVENAAQKIATSLKEAKVDRPTALLFGGETTVRLRGDGRGGRNQELALHIARLCDGTSSDWVFLSGGTDGRDGPTDAAGAAVDAESWSRISQSGEDPEALLNNNDSYRALDAAGDLIRTGGTGTNVADVQVLLVKPNMWKT
ncbi:MAG: glycerate kinase, partial [Epibacterium sp.]|nr:glycerate kinase [Epibacterium sp.]NQX74862.1 glycerate kinase [Epibacterium sp.]